MKNKYLKIRLIEKEKTHKDIAKAVGVTPQAITDYIRGAYNPSHEVMAKIAKELDSTVDELFFKDID
jgi:DNA-binding XRE family transcriptional regulator